MFNCYKTGLTGPLEGGVISNGFERVKSAFDSQDLIVNSPL